MNDDNVKKADELKKEEFSEPECVLVEFSFENILAVGDSPEGGIIPPEQTFAP